MGTIWFSEHDPIQQSLPDVWMKINILALSICDAFVKL